MVSVVSYGWAFLESVKSELFPSALHCQNLELEHWLPEEGQGCNYCSLMLMCSISLSLVVKNGP